VISPTKLILIGEHSVVYGKRGITIPLPKYTKITIKNHSNFLITTNNLDLKQNLHYLEKQIYFILEAEEITVTNFHINIDLQVPVGVGLGVSASISVALIQSLFEFFSIPLSKEKLFSLSFELEKQNHSNPSGIDHTTIIENKSLLFQKSNDRLNYQILPELYDSKILQNCYIINTGKPEETTGQMVNWVKKQREKHFKKINNIFNELDILVDPLQKSLKENNRKLFTSTINKTGLLLENLGIVPENTKKLSREIRKSGGSVKISGAGGIKTNSGILFIYHEKKDILKNSIYDYNIIELK